MKRTSLLNWAVFVPPPYRNPGFVSVISLWFTSHCLHIVFSCRWIPTRTTRLSENFSFLFTTSHLRSVWLSAYFVEQDSNLWTPMAFQTLTLNGEQFLGFYVKRWAKLLKRNPNLIFYQFSESGGISVIQTCLKNLLCKLSLKAQSITRYAQLCRPGSIERNACHQTVRRDFSNWSEVF